MPIRLTVIGGGPGGYTAAFAAARAGMSVTLVESGNLGGTCLNNGCIPTKTLKASADALELALRLSQFGITGQGAPAVDPAAVLARKEKVCATLRGGLEKACASLGVRLLKGRGRLVHAGLVEASTAEGPVSVEGDRVILATGSGALELPGLPVDHTHILTSDDALALDRVPASIAIVGGGVIGCELAFIYQAFGSKVTVVEGQNRLLPLPSVDADMSALLQREMKKRRIGCELGRTLKDVRVEGGMVRAMLGASPFIKEPTPAQMKETPIEAETVLVTVGRAPNTAGLGLAEAGVAVDGRGWIRADEHMRTSLPGVYAVGDALGPSRIMLAHVAAAEGLCAVRDCLGRVGVDVAVDVRMTVDQLVAQAVDHIRIVERSSFGAQFRVEDDMQHQVAQLLADALHVAVENGVGQFVGLLDRVAAQRLEGLLAVPRALCAQFVHDLQQSQRCRGTFVLFHWQ